MLRFGNFKSNSIRRWQSIFMIDTRHKSKKLSYYSINKPTSTNQSFFSIFSSGLCCSSRPAYAKRLNVARLFNAVETEKTRENKGKFRDFPGLRLACQTESPRQRNAVRTPVLAKTHLDCRILNNSGNVVIKAFN